MDGVGTSSRQRPLHTQPISPAILRVFGRLTRGVTTVNQLNRVLIGLENRMSPGEEDAVFRHIMGSPLGAPTLSHKLRGVVVRAVAKATGLSGKTTLTPMARYWLLRRWAQSLWDHSRLAGRFESASYTRSWARRGALFFRSNAPTSGLLVAVAGKDSRLGFRTPSLLRFVAPLGCDVLLLRTNRMESYSEGIAGLGSDVEQVAQAIGQMVAQAQYPRVGVLAVSKGTQLGLLLTGLLRAPKLLLASPSSLHSEDIVANFATTTGAVDRLQVALEWTYAQTQAHVAYATDSPEDVRIATDILGRFQDGHPYPVAHDSHSVPWPMAVDGTFGDFLGNLGYFPPSRVSHEVAP